MADLRTQVSAVVQAWFWGRIGALGWALFLRAIKNDAAYGRTSIAQPNGPGGDIVISFHDDLRRYLPNDRAEVISDYWRRQRHG